jgi:hypothetical protein
MRFIPTAILLFALIVPAMGGDGAGPPVTGNARIDFFSVLAPVNSEGRIESVSPLLQDVEGRERSPLLAAGLSLAIPGAGQVYNEDYWKAGIFVAAEAASWIIAIAYDNKGDKQTKDFERFANLHWSAIQYANWTMDNITVLNPNVTRTGDDYRDLVFTDDPEGVGPPFPCIDWERLNEMERDVASGSNGYTHVLPGYGEQQYYELIGKYEQFSRGWDDADLSDVSVPMRSNSARFFEYARMRAKANDYYDVASSLVAVAVVNHILSAAEAFWSASRHNSALHAEVKLNLQPSGGKTVPMTVAKLTYTF